MARIDPQDRAIQRLVTEAKQRARVRAYTGLMTPENQRVIQYCTTILRITPWSQGTAEAVRFIYTRDDGMHDIGWWKNPAYSRCLHLSVSFIALDRDPNFPDQSSAVAHLPQNHVEARALCLAFYAEHARKLWVEPPFSPEGHKADVYHYRLFMSEGWAAPVELKGEVYSPLMARGWKSWSEQHPPGAYGLGKPP